MNMHGDPGMYMGQKRRRNPFVDPEPEVSIPEYPEQSEEIQDMPEDMASPGRSVIRRLLRRGTSVRNETDAELPPEFARNRLPTPVRWY